MGGIVGGRQQFRKKVHSIRIGACVLLHELGHSAVFIKNRLHWKSDTFMDYLRDTVTLARKHAASLLSTLRYTFISPLMFSILNKY